MLTGELFIPGETVTRVTLTESMEKATPVRRFDVFISHYHGDLAIARLAAIKIQQAGYSAYLDHADPNIDGDDPDLEAYLRLCIGRSKGLYALISQQTQLSWWVPLEAGVALEQGKEIATTPLSLRAFYEYPSYFKTKTILESPRISDDIIWWAQKVHRLPRN